MTFSRIHWRIATMKLFTWESKEVTAPFLCGVIDQCFANPSNNFITNGEYYIRWLIK